MEMLKQWMETLREDRNNLTVAIHELISVLSTNLPNKNSHPSVPKFNDSECHYAGVYFVHN